MSSASFFPLLASLIDTRLYAADNPSKSRVDFSTLPVSQLDTYVSYYELAPTFPPALDPAPPPLLLGGGSGEVSAGSGSRSGESVDRSAHDSQDGADAAEGAADADEGREEEMDKDQQEEHPADAAAATASGSNSRKRKAAAPIEIDDPPLSTLLSVGRRAAAAAASTKMRGDIQDPYGDHAAASSVDHANSSADAAHGQQHRVSPSAGGTGGSGPDSFFDGEAANTYLSSVAGAHFAGLPQPKEGEIVVGFLYKCKTRGEQLACDEDQGDVELIDCFALSQTRSSRLLDGFLCRVLKETILLYTVAITHIHIRTHIGRSASQ